MRLIFIFILVLNMTVICSSNLLAVQIKGKSNFIKAEELWKKGEINDAEELYLKAIETETENSEIYFKLGIINNDKRKFKKSLDYFNKSLNFKCTNKSIYYFLGKTNFKCNKFEESLKWFLKTHELNLRNNDALNHIIKIYEIKKEYKTSLEYCEKILKFNPDSLTVNYKKSILFFKLGDFENSMKESMMILKKYPKNSNSKLLVSFIFLLQNKMNKAEELLKEFYEKDKLNASILNEVIENKIVRTNEVKLDYLIEIMENKNKFKYLMYIKK